MTRRSTVELRTDLGTRTVEVESSVVATDAAVVDMARRQAGIPAALFGSGEVVTP